MRLLPIIAGTVAKWPLQGSLVDASGLAGTLTTLNAFTSNPGGTEQYGAMDSCVQGFKFDAATKLIAPAVSSLRLAGAWTIQFLMHLSAVTGGPLPWVCCVDPAGRSGGASSDRIGSVFTWFIDTLTPGDHLYWTDKAIGSNIPVPGGKWWNTTGASMVGTNLAIAIRSTPFGGLGATNIDTFINGVKQTSTIAATVPTIAGTERFYLGGIEVVGETPPNDSLLADVRVLNGVSRDDAGLLADATAQLGPCAAAFAYRGVRIRLDKHQ